MPLFLVQMKNLIGHYSHLKMYWPKQNKKNPHRFSLVKGSNYFLLDASTKTLHETSTNIKLNNQLNLNEDSFLWQFSAFI